MKDPQTTDPASNAAQHTEVPKKRKHKLEIQVYEADYEDMDRNGGKPKWRPVRTDPALDGGRPNIIEVANKAEFAEIQKQYAMCDQMIKVIREIDPFTDEEVAKPSSSSGNIPKDNQAIPVDSSISQQNALQADSQVHAKIAVKAPANIQTAIPKPKPKIVTIGDIEVKYDGDKVYQKQWMKLTPTEASNFRVVNDTNNKIVSLTGKHIEAKRWMLVEDSSEGSIDDAVESILKG